MSSVPSRQTCEEAFRKVDDYLDRRLAPEEVRQIEEHLRICAVCARDFAFEASILNNVREKLRRIAAPGDLLSRIAAQLARAAAERDGG